MGFVENINRTATVLTDTFINNIDITAGNIGNIETVSDSITNVNKVAVDIVNVNTVASISEDVNTVASGLENINIVVDNINDVTSVATTIIPNLVEILLADTNAAIATTKAGEAQVSATLAASSASSAASSATTATTKASEASISASNALNSENKAEKWADEAEDVEVEAGKYSAKHWSEKSKDWVLGSTIDDSTPRIDKSYSGSKVQTEIDRIGGILQEQGVAIIDNTASIIALAKSNATGSFGATGLALNLSGSETILPFTVTQQSTNVDKFELGTNDITIKSTGNYTFLSTVVFEDNGANGSVGTVTFRVRDAGTVYYMQTATVEISGYDRDTVPFNSLLVVPSGIPITAYITASCNVSGYRIAGFESVLASEKAAGELSSMADHIAVTPSGNLTSINVQDALEELDTEKATKATTLAGYGITDAININQRGVANGVATLDGAGLIPSTQLPAYVDDVLEFTDLAMFPVTGVSGKIYLDMVTNKTYRWGGSSYVYITSGAVDSVNGQTGVVNVTSIVGNAGTATTLQTARSITITGDMSYAVSFNGSANVTATGVLSNTGVIAGEYQNVTVDAKGRVVAGTNFASAVLSALSI